MPPDATTRRHTLAKSFGWATRGLCEAAHRERNMRLHLALGVPAAALAAVGPFTGGERALLLLCVALVVAGEAANSALEAVVDLLSPGPSPRARVAKDSAAGAVLALAVGSVAVLGAVLLPVLPQLRTQLPALWPAAAGAALAGVCAGLLPAPGARPAAAGPALLIAGLVGIGLVARSAVDPAGVVAALLLVAVGAGGAVLRTPPS
ncbi:MAG: diacylglycerol kinase [Anaeromyxobacter sp.]